MGISQAVCVFFCLALILILSLPHSGASQNADPLFGTWLLNLKESTFLSGPPTYKSVTCKIEPWKDGLRVTYDMVGWRGGVTHWEWTGPVDGRDYPLQGVDEVITHAYRRLDSYTYSVLAKLDGRVTTNTKIVISPDGRSMKVASPVSTAQGQSVLNTAVYDRR